jgi:purine-binding chemotaxis protein CheW
MKISEELRDLKKRELIYSHKREEEQISSDKKKYLLFSCNKIIMAVSLRSVEAIYNFDRINPIPLVPGYVLGLFNHRGIVSPVIDLYSLIQGEPSLHLYLLVFKGTNNVLTSLAITELLELIPIEDQEIHNIGVNAHENIRRFARGELSDGTLVLNTDLGGIL